MNAAENILARQPDGKELMAKGLTVLITDGESDTAFKVMTSLAMVPRIKIHVLSASTTRPRTRYSRFCSSYTFRPDGPEQGWFEQISDAVEEKRIQVILPVHAEAVRFASVWREQLSELAALPPLPDASVFDLAHDKGSLATFLHERGLPVPTTIPATHALDHPNLMFPALIKPRRLMGGEGIAVCPDKKTLKESIDAHRHELEDYIVQEFVGGRDFAATAFCRDGGILAHTLREFTAPRPRVFGPSCSVRYIDWPQLYEIVERLMFALRWDGIANVGFKYNERTQRPEILDFNPRFGGNTVSSAAAGVNFAWLSCLAALRLPLPESRRRLQEYMEIRDAVKRIMRKLKGQGGVIPNLLRETNLPFILRDPAPYLNRKCDR